MLPPAYFVSHLVLMVFLHFVWPLAYWNLGLSRWAGLPLAVLGVVVVATCVRRFDSTTTLYPFDRPSVFVTDGFYRYSRNPMYTALAISLVAAAIMLGSVTPMFAIPVFVCSITVRFIVHEERTLERSFGAEYLAYKSRVRRWL